MSANVHSYDDYLQQEKKLNAEVASLSRKLIKVIEQFEPLRDSADRDWNFYLKLKRKWILFGVKEYKKVYYFFASNFDSFSYNSLNKELQDVKYPADLVTALAGVLEALPLTLAAMKQDAIGYHRTLRRSISPAMRIGVIHRSFVRQFIPDWMRYDKELGERKTKAMIKLIEQYRVAGSVDVMTAGKYFEYCKVAYLANKKHSMKDVSLSASGRELYLRWADGRDGGLSTLDLNSEQAFAEWLNGGTRVGGHPWEIYRGGNTTHIDLSVERFSEKWRVALSAYSSTRLAETCRIALELDKAGLPFVLRHERSYLKRLACEDFVGIIPEYDSVHRGWQRFPQEFGVADCIQMSWFRDDSTGKWPLPARKIATLVDWLPERPLRLAEPG